MLIVPANQREPKASYYYSYINYIIDNEKSIFGSISISDGTLTDRQKLPTLGFSSYLTIVGIPIQPQGAFTITQKI